MRPVTGKPNRISTVKQHICAGLKASRLRYDNIYRNAHLYVLHMKTSLRHILCTDSSGAFYTGRCGRGKPVWGGTLLAVVGVDAMPSIQCAT